MGGRPLHFLGDLIRLSEMSEIFQVSPNPAGAQRWRAEPQICMTRCLHFDSIPLNGVAMESVISEHPFSQGQ